MAGTGTNVTVCRLPWVDDVGITGSCGCHVYRCLDGHTTIVHYTNCPAVRSGSK